MSPDRNESHSSDSTKVVDMFIPQGNSRYLRIPNAAILHTSAERISTDREEVWTVRIMLMMMMMQIMMMRINKIKKKKEKKKLLLLMMMMLLLVRHTDDDM